MAKIRCSDFTSGLKRIHSVKYGYQFGARVFPKTKNEFRNVKTIIKSEFYDICLFFAK